MFKNNGWNEGEKLNTTNEITIGYKSESKNNKESMIINEHWKRIDQLTKTWDESIKNMKLTKNQVYVQIH